MCTRNREELLRFRGNVEGLLRVSWFSEIAVYRLTPAGPNIQHPSLPQSNVDNIP